MYTHVRERAGAPQLNGQDISIEILDVDDGMYDELITKDKQKCCCCCLWAWLLFQNLPGVVCSSEKDNSSSEWFAVEIADDSVKDTLVGRR